jgi:sugar lactone lactonase YvrE
MFRASWSCMARCALALVLCWLATLASAADHPEPAQSLSLRQNLSSGRASLRWLSRDPALSLPSGDPRLLGATLRVTGIDQTAIFDLAASGWDASTSGDRFRFVGRKVTGAPSPIRGVFLRQGKALSVRGGSSGIALDDPQQGVVSIALVVGNDTYCAVCTAPHADQPGRYQARDCSAPTSCGGGTTTTTTNTTLGTGTQTTSTTSTTLCNVLLEWGEFGSDPGQFYNPYGVGVSADGQSVYTVELGTDRVQKFDSDGQFITQWGGSGAAPGQFDVPVDVAVSAAGDVYVVDQNNHRVQKFDADGAFVTMWGGAGSANGAFLNPRGIGIDANGDVYVADAGNYRMQKFDGGGVFLTKWTTGFPNSGQYAPRDVAADGTQFVYVTHISHPLLQRFQTDGTLVDTPINSPPQSSVAVDDLGRVYYGEPELRRWEPGGQPPGVVAWAGGTITGIATAPGNVVYVSDYGYSRIVKLLCP